MIDTHTHIYLEEFDEDRVEVVRRAREAGVERVILPNVDFDTVQAMHATNDLFPGYCRMAMGLHPTSVEADYRELLEQVRESGLPVIIHCRGAFDEISALLQSGRVPAFRGVFHSFTGSAEQVRLLRGTGDYYFGINGIVTFKNAHLEDMVREVGIGRILLETDAPYLAPVPYRGKRTTVEVEEATTANAVRLFGEG